MSLCVVLMTMWTWRTLPLATTAVTPEPLRPVSLHHHPTHQTRQSTSYYEATSLVSVRNSGILIARKVLLEMFLNLSLLFSCLLTFSTSLLFLLHRDHEHGVLPPQYIGVRAGWTGSRATVSGREPDRPTGKTAREPRPPTLWNQQTL